MMCVKKNYQYIPHSELRDIYLSSMTLADSKRIESYHHKVHGIRGMIGSLDGSRVTWGNCPKAYRGHYVGKEGKSTIVVEALADHSLYAKRYFDEAPRNFLKKKFLRSNPTPYPASTPRYPYAYSR